MATLCAWPNRRRDRKTLSGSCSGKNTRQVDEQAWEDVDGHRVTDGVDFGVAVFPFGLKLAQGAGKAPGIDDEVTAHPVFFVEYQLFAQVPIRRRDR